MKALKWFAPAMVAALVLCGCKQPTHPAFAPVGNGLAYERNGDLHLRSGSRDRVIGRNVEGDVAWSADGRRIAFYGSDHDTVIFSVASGKRVVASGIGFPYAWLPQGLLAFRSLPTGQAGTDLVILNPATGKVRSAIRFTGQAADFAAPAGHGALLWTFEKTTYFDGRTCRSLPKLNGADPVWISSDGMRWTFARRYAKPNTHRMLLDLFTWTPSAPETINRKETIDLGKDFEGITGAVDAQGSPDGSIAVSVLRVKPAKEEAERFYAMIDMYDILNHLFDSPSTIPNDVNKELSEMLDRGEMRFAILTRRQGGSWKSVLDSRFTNKSSDAGFIDLSRDGRTVALSTPAGTRLYPLR